MTSNVDLKIHYVQGSVTAFSLNLDFYFLRTEPIPQIFDVGLTPQTVANIDSWFQAKTQQRYSYRGFLDMVGAFKDGLAHTYSRRDLEEICQKSALAAKSYVLTERMAEYGKHYWIEILNPVSLDTVHAQAIRDKFEHLRTKLGDDELFNNLCRLLKFAQRNRPGLVSVFERLIKRLGRIQQDPHYPETNDLDIDLQRAVLAIVLEKGIAAYKGIAIDIQTKIESLLHVERTSPI